MTHEHWGLIEPRQQQPWEAGLLGAGVGGLDGLAVVGCCRGFIRSRNRMPGSAWS